MSRGRSEQSPSPNSIAREYDQLVDFIARPHVDEKKVVATATKMGKLAISDPGYKPRDKFISDMRNIKQDNIDRERNQNLKREKQKLLDDIMALYSMIEVRDRNTRNQQIAKKFFKLSDKGQFQTRKIQEFYKDWKWLHQYMNNSIARDFFNRFVFCGKGPVPKGKFPGDAYSCHMNGLRGYLALKRI